MEKNRPLVRTNPVSEEDEDFSDTRRVSMKALVENISLDRRCFLEIHHPGLTSISIELDKQDITIGRGSQCRIQLKVDNASRLHARLAYRDEEYHIEDMESTNGTFVNSVRIQRCVLRNNDHIQIGAAKVIFIEEEIRRKSK